MSSGTAASLVFIGIVVVSLFIMNLPRRNLATSYQKADHKGVVLYWRPDCRYCMKLRTRLRFTRLRHSEVNIWQDPEAAAFVRSVAGGNETVPTVTVAGKAMVNPSKKQLFAAIKANTSA
jgi:glutaredoxin